MPELPEVETVRRGLEPWVVGRTVTGVEVLRERSVRRHVGGAVDLAARLSGRTVQAAVRRGKYLWLTLDPGDEALLVHLGMSGQVLVSETSAVGVPLARPDPAHLRVRVTFADGAQVRFVDQRTFGHVLVTDLVPTPDGGPGGQGSGAPLLPAEAAHIARDLLDPLRASGTPGRAGVVTRLRARRTTVKRALLDQTLVSGVGNIYADEGLWRARLHYDRPTDALTRRQAEAVLDGVEAVMRAALEVGGTSFDAMYVNVNGRSGYFDRSLVAYGQAGRPCPRCGAPVVREHFMNRSSFRCPRCQGAPRRRPVSPRRTSD